MPYSTLPSLSWPRTMVNQQGEAELERLSVIEIFRMEELEVEGDVVVFRLSTPVAIGRIFDLPAVARRLESLRCLAPSSGDLRRLLVPVDGELVGSTHFARDDPGGGVRKPASRR
ncbi:hypothetical protein EJB05_02094 [Eragrostis curvula]|uniref:Uncharacterized protein n=1 Tax=Eragrostis curvula TaxID=38414 RepID=A0A5J9WS13_9POAL|nr:hypothetical protein EJB05_02094 [Eragrostis curvula]